MKRLTFLSLFGLGAVGQGPLPAPKLPHPLESPNFQTPGEYRPVAQLYMTDGGNWYLRNNHANGECPVCGTQAPPWKRPRMQTWGTCPEGMGKKSIGKVCTKEGEPYGAQTLLIRCATCNNAFFQDAEKETTR